MSPLTLRRYRAERLLRDDFVALRVQVLASVRHRLRCGRVELDESDLEACYAMAWQGLYGAVLDGQEIANPVGWLVLVTYRRAIEEHRANELRRRLREEVRAGELEPDLAAQLDDRRRLRALFAGMRGRLDAREREAAMLCYLQGLSRPEAAARMGLSETQMRRLMDGRGAGRPGVAGKVGTLVQTIAAGSWCDEQASLMRAFAYGVLDPAGERHALALAHCEECPACRAYVASLRGLAAVLPPVLSPFGIAAHLLAGANSGSTQLAGAGAATGGSAAAGGWALAGTSAGKLAVGCVLSLSVGVGCVALVGGRAGATPPHPHHRAAASHAHRHRAALATAAVNVPAAQSEAPASAPAPPAASAVREFGPEQALARHPALSVGPRSLAGGASATAARELAPRGAGSATNGSESKSTSPTAREAAREFAPG
ncbi:MAG TPA: sigma-70 family RNA polymerase sigma factor [Solirubrobacteraceae bacterium]|jgi:DNA-directed RNA polymerase specialized sigma24 family protein